MKTDYSNLSILVVEDNKEMQKAILHFLQYYVPTLEHAQNGVAGLEYFKIHRPEIVITDYDMPKLDGLSMAREIKAIAPETQIILISDFDSSEMFIEAINIGIDHFVNKPIQADKLIEALEKCAYMQSYREQEKEHSLISTAEAVRQSKAALLCNIAHHWRNPLNIVSLSVSAMQDEMEDEGCYQRYQKYFEPVYHACGQMSRTITYFTHMFSSSALKSKFCLNRCLSETLELHKDWLDENRIVLECSLPEGEYHILGVQANLQLAIYQIIKNAIDALSVRPNKRRFNVSLRREDGMGVIEFQDNGPGFDECILPHSTDPYCSTKGIESGQGLGLFVVSRVTCSLNGKLYLGNSEDGAKITLKVPLED